MAQPDPKTPGINKFLEDLNQVQFGHSRLESIQNDVCVRCGNPATEFKDHISRVEFTISGFCQNCQDTAFAPFEEGEDYDHDDAP